VPAVFDDELSGFDPESADDFDVYPYFCGSLSVVELVYLRPKLYPEKFDETFGSSFFAYPKT